MKYQYELTWFERWMLNRIARRITIQSHAHRKNLVEYISIMKYAIFSEFREDNLPTLSAYFDECVEDADKAIYLRYSNYPTPAMRNNTYNSGTSKGNLL